MKKVAIIANSDYIDDNIIRIYLNNEFEVKVSTNNITNKEQYEHLMLLKNSDRLHIAEVDIKKKEALNDFVKDSDFVVFTNALEFHFCHI